MAGVCPTVPRCRLPTARCRRRRRVADRFGRVGRAGSAVPPASVRSSWPPPQSACGLPCRGRFPPWRQARAPGDPRRRLPSQASSGMPVMLASMPERGRRARCDRSAAVPPARHLQPRARHRQARGARRWPRRRHRLRSLHRQRLQCRPPHLRPPPLRVSRTASCHRRTRLPTWPRALISSPSARGRTWTSRQRAPRPRCRPSTGGVPPRAWARWSCRPTGRR